MEKYQVKTTNINHINETATTTTQINVSLWNLIPWTVEVILPAVRHSLVRNNAATHHTYSARPPHIRWMACVYPHSVRRTCLSINHEMRAAPPIHKRKHSINLHDEPHHQHNRHTNGDGRIRMLGMAYITSAQLRSSHSRTMPLPKHSEHIVEWECTRERQRERANERVCWRAGEG